MEIGKDMKGKIIVSFLTSAMLCASAPLVLAQSQEEDDDVPTIAGVPVTTAVAVGIVGATIIGAAVDNDDNQEDPVAPPVETTPPSTTTPATTTTTTTTTTST